MLSNINRNLLPSGNGMQMCVAAGLSMVSHKKTVKTKGKKTRSLKSRSNRQKAKRLK